MKYLCLVYYEEKIINAMTKDEWGALNGECIACVAGFQQTGRFLGGNPLEPVHTASTVRIRNGKASVTDGPFAETKEQLAGYYLLEACDLNEAIQLASKIPPARLGSIEVRPIRELASE